MARPGKARPEGGRRRTEVRGRLSSIDLLPEEAEEDVIWACRQLNERKRTQLDILDEFNGRLAGRGLAPVSRSAFNRKAMRLASLRQRLDEARYVFAGIRDQFTDQTIDESSIGLGETIKALILELLRDDNATPKVALELARAYLAIIQGQKVSAERRQKLDAERRATEKKAVATVEAIMEKRGLSRETLGEFKARFLGMGA